MLFAPILIPFNGRIARYVAKGYSKKHETLIKQLEGLGHDFSRSCDFMWIWKKWAILR